MTKIFLCAGNSKRKLYQHRFRELQAYLIMIINSSCIITQHVVTVPNIAIRSSTCNEIFHVLDYVKILSGMGRTIRYTSFFLHYH